MKGEKEKKNLEIMMKKRMKNKGYKMRKRKVELKEGIEREMEEKVWKIMEKRSVENVMDMIFQMKDEWRENERMEEGRNIGKIVMEIEQNIEIEKLLIWRKKKYIKEMI